MNRSLSQYRADRERGRKRAHRLKWLLVFAAAAFVMVVLAQGVLPADAQAGFQSSHPMGFFGDGHEVNHHHYDGLVNARKSSCCNGRDCRPTQGRWNGIGWDIMINGQWRTLPASENWKFITAEVFAMQGRQRWDTQAHVCTDETGNLVYCIIPPASGG